MRNLRRFAFLLLLFASSAFSQTANVSGDAQLTGTLTDPSGAGVGSVEITAKPEDRSSGMIYKATSRTDGEYSVGLSAGKYHVRFVRAPFVERAFDLSFAPGETRTLDLRLELERLSASVVVTAQVEPITSEDSPAPVTVISRTEIKQRQSVSLPELLATQSGVSIARTGPEGGLATLFLDGGNSNFTKVLVDGVPMNDPGGFLNYSNLTLDNVDKVEIVHGAESALYGTDAVSGVIQIFTHRGTTRTPAANLFAEGGSLSSARGGGQLSGRLGDFDYSTAASYFQTDGQGANDGFLNRTVSGNFGYSVSDSDHLRLTVRSNSSFAGTPGPTLQGPPNLAATDALHILSSNLSWDFRAGSHWEHRLSGGETRILDVSADPPFPAFVDQFNRAGLQAQSTYFYRQGIVAGGYSYEVENGFPGGAHARRNNHAGFLDARYRPHHRVTLNTGAGTEANASFGTRVVPRAGVALALRYGTGFWGDTRFHVFYGLGIKEPALEQSFATDPCFPGNPSLKAERSRTFYAGLEQFLASNKLRVSADYFTNRFRDIVSFAPGSTITSACPFETGTYFNTDLARARGVNFTLQSQPLRWLTIQGSYSYDATRVLRSANPFADPALVPGNPLLRRPPHSGSLLLNVAHRRLNWNLSGYFTGRRTDSNFVNPQQFENPGYARFDVSTNYEAGRGLSFNGRVTNLFDKAYQDALGFPALGRDFRLGMRYRFGGKE